MTRSLLLDLPAQPGSSPACARSAAASVKIAIVEPLLMLRELMVRAFEQEFGCLVVADAESGAQALAVADQQPHVVIIDLPLPGSDGFSLIEHIQKNSPASKILVLSGGSDDYTVFRVEKANVHGFIDKRDSSVAELKEAVTTLARGGTYFSKSYETVRKARHADPRSFDKILSESEQKVLRVIGEGMTDEEIGHLLRISPRTVRTHRHNILQKLRVAGTPKLIAYAIQHGFTTRTPPVNPGGDASHPREAVASRLTSGA